MGPSMEQAPLLTVPTQQVFDTLRPNCATQPLEAHNWHGELCDFCGPSCSAQDWWSCALGSFFPCYAFGSNVRRAFRTSIWSQALVFLVCFFVIRWSATATVGYTADVCKAGISAREAQLPSRFDASAHDTWLSGRKLLQIDDGPGKFAEAFADVLSSAAATAVIYGRDVDNAQAGSLPTPADGVKPVSEPKTLPVVVSATKEGSISDCHHDPADGALVCHKHAKPSQGLPHAFILPFTPVYASATPDCQKAYMFVSILHYIVVVAGIFWIVYAARLRTLMRQKFSIPGSSWCDLLTWTFCWPCALCQETRTLRANNVFDGKWGNAPESGQIVSAADWIGPVASKPPKMVEV